MDILNLVSSTIASTTNIVTYECVLTNNWSGANHPFDYARVSNSAHWSSPVLASHNSLYEMWAPEMLASPGVENIAETGSTGTLKSELNAAMNSGTVADFSVGINQFNNRDPPQEFDEIFLSNEYPLLSTISMVAPSPDWFTGLSSFSPIDEANQVWYDSFEIASYPFDAGTETGNTYSTGNPAEDPPMEIFELTIDTVPNNGILLDESGTEVLPVAVWTCELKSSTCIDDASLRFRRKRRRRRRVNCQWVGRKKTRKRCKRNWKGKTLADFCPVTCDNCE